MDRAATLEERIDKILSFVVVAKPQTDDDSKRTQVTLTPCKLCRDRMLRSAEEDAGNKPPRISLETEVITANADQTAFRKYQKVKDLLTFHGEYVEID